MIQNLKEKISIKWDRKANEKFRGTYLDGGRKLASGFFGAGTSFVEFFGRAELVHLLRGLQIDHDLVHVAHFGLFKVCLCVHPIVFRKTNIRGRFQKLALANNMEKLTYFLS